MLQATKKAIEAILSTDPSVDARKISSGLRVLAGEAPVQNEGDVLISRSEAAHVLGVVPATITLYAKRGLIHPVWCGAGRVRASGYSRRSVQELLARQ